MIKIVTDEFLDEMSEWLTPTSQNEPCSDCCDVKRAVKNEDIKQFRRLTNATEEETAAAMGCCRQCLWYWVDEVEELEEDIGKNPEGRITDEA